MQNESLREFVSLHGAKNEKSFRNFGFLTFVTLPRETRYSSLYFVAAYSVSVLRW